jgi:Leucine-rich repeat (LRR) protein
MNGDLGPLSKLHLLSYLDASVCSFNGTLEPLRELKNLTKIILSTNHLSGTLKPLADLHKLNQLDVSGFNALSGTLDPLAELINLQRLTLGWPTSSANFNRCFPQPGFKLAECNVFTGTLAPLSNLTGLSFLSVLASNLTGPLDALAQLTSLVDLELNNNQLSGPLEPLGGLTKLQTLDVGSYTTPCRNPGCNALTGTLDPIYNLHALTRLNLGRNKLVDIVGDGLRKEKMPNLVYLSLANNNFTGAPSNAVNWATFTNFCALNGNDFTCPEPSSAETSCQATCH